jgi:hypothetical protein
MNMSARWVIIFLLVAATAHAADKPDAASVFRSLEEGNSGAARPGKPWLDNFAGFVADHPGSWVVGRSHDPCLSEAEAAQAARADATAEFFSLISSRLHNSLNENALRRRLEADIAAGKLQADQLVERFDRPYGAVWAESVLLDASPKRLEPLIAGYERTFRDQQRRLHIWRAAAVGSAAVAWVLYLFLNSATRGYFTIRLRIAAALVTVAAIVLFI